MLISKESTHTHTQKQHLPRGKEHLKTFVLVPVGAAHITLGVSGVVWTKGPCNKMV